MNARRDPPRPRPPAPADDWALFLDVDGCLLDFADAPGMVAVPEALHATLEALARRLQGALALVSGRPIAGIDALFAPLQFAETRGRIWIYENKQLRSVPVRLGITDGTNQELIEGDLKEGQEVVVNMVTGLEPVNRPGQTGAGNPLMGPQRGGPGGGQRGGGGGRGF